LGIIPGLFLAKSELKSQDEAGFLTLGSLPAFAPSPSAQRVAGESAQLWSWLLKSGSPITVAGPCGILTHFPFTLGNRGTIISGSKRSRMTRSSLPPGFGIVKPYPGRP